MSEMKQLFICAPTENLKNGKVPKMLHLGRKENMNLLLHFQISSKYIKIEVEKVVWAIYGKKIEGELGHIQPFYFYEDSYVGHI